MKKLVVFSVVIMTAFLGIIIFNHKYGEEPASLVKTEPARLVKNIHSDRKTNNNLSALGREEPNNSGGSLEKHTYYGESAEKQNHVTAGSYSGEVVEVRADADLVDKDGDEDLYRVALQTWDEERTTYYLEKLDLDDEKIELIRSIDQEAAQKIQQIVDQITSEPPFITNEQYQNSTNEIIEAYGLKVQQIMGKERFKQALTFREDFNKQAASRFGVRMRITGF